jgi:8-oxo-dGTP diphosphatase
MKVATLCYLHREFKGSGQTLFLHRNVKEGDMHYMKHVGLGGRIERGESPEECVFRETFEESGYQLIRPSLKAVLTFDNTRRMFGDNPAKEDWYVFVYTAGEFEGKMRHPDEGKLKWVSDSRIAGLEMHEGDKIFHPWLYVNGIIEGKITHVGQKLDSANFKRYAV